MRRRAWPAAGALGLMLALMLPAACGGSGPDDGEEAVWEALRMMVVQEEDLPAPMRQVDESFLSNEEVARSSPEGGPRLQRLERLRRWGRILGYETTFQPAATPSPSGSPLRGINASASLYETAAGASQSFADAAETARQEDWELNYAGLEEFQQREVAREGLADEMLWLRFTGYEEQEGGGRTLVIDDLVFFRVDRERGFLRVLAEAEGDDRELLLDQVEGWLRRQVQRVRETLAALEAEAAPE